MSDRLGNALAAVFCLVIVAKLAGLELAGGSAGRSGTSADNAALKNDLCLDSGIAAGVDDFTTDYINDS